ncbi:MAG: D-aminoacylase [Candidatus Latescibacteria bacterium]|nr:D-aminoacylase [Candidatus Latescibacterota bacterium]
MRLLLTKGALIDGTGAPARPADVLVEEGRIRAIGAIPEPGDARVLDCTGLVVAPGVSDVHSHADIETLEHRPEKIRQGITTEIVGNCGFSVFPTLGQEVEHNVYQMLFGRNQRSWGHAGEYFADLEASGSYTNTAVLAGHNTIRTAAMGLEQRHADRAEMRQMALLLEASLEQGAMGLSTGLNEVPGSYGDGAELRALCRLVREYDGYYTSHLRDYKFGILEAVEEALALGRSTGVPVQLSHLQTVGSRNWDKMDRVLELVDKAVREGVAVGIDAYPYLAGSCNLTQFLPGWALEGGAAGLLQRLAEPGTRRRIAAETDAGMANTWADIAVANLASAANQQYLGQTIAQIGTARGQEPVDAALSLLAEEQGTVTIISFNQSEANLRKVLSHPLTSIITDGLYTEGRPHPRTFGTYPKFLGDYVREKGWMPLEAAMHKTSGLPARRFGLADRGSIEVGNWADLVVFAPHEIGTRSDYLNPNQPPQGISWVLVNGQIAVEAGQLVGAPAGQPIRHDRPG